MRELSRLPSVGEKSATRLAYHLIQNDRRLAEGLSEAIRQACSNVGLCQECFFFAESGACRFCLDPARDTSLLCVVEKPMDVVAFERMGEFYGSYHVLHGLWAPLRGLGPESMRLAELLARVKRGTVKEVVIATGSTVEGDATGLYIAHQLQPLNVQITRLAQGMPKGGELEYSDEVTLARALSGRSPVRCNGAA